MEKIESLYEIPQLTLYVEEYGVLDWFEVHLFHNGCLIKNGLRHADGETKSPYYYEKSFWGNTYKEDALEDFNEFLQSLKLID